MTTNLHEDRDAFIHRVYDAFTKDENQIPDYVIVSPGRVNLIGDHIDHQGYSVLPIAIPQSITLAVGWVTQTTQETPLLRIRHAQYPTDFPEESYKSVEDIYLKKTHSWTDYIVCAFWGAAFMTAGTDSIDEFDLQRGVPVMDPYCRTFIQRIFSTRPHSTLCLHIMSTLPLAAGLSSSSSLLVGALGAFLKSFDNDISRYQVANAAAKLERYLGAAGGGMDQAAICLSRVGVAQLTHFHPLRCEPVSLPKQLSIVVCNSGCHSFKITEAATRYNKRVFEMIVASILLLQDTGHLTPTDDLDVSTLTLSVVQSQLDCTIPEMLHVLGRSLSTLPYSKNDLENVIGAKRINEILHKRVGQHVWTENVMFEPYRRALHVFSEVQRVADFVQVCRNITTDASQYDALEKLGRLIDESNNSLTLYLDNSTVELNRLTRLAKTLGAYGSRIIGAGWGGCIIALVNKDNANAFLKDMKDSLTSQINTEDNSTYHQRVPDIFLVYPENGLTVYNSSCRQIEWV